MFIFIPIFQIVRVVKPQLFFPYTYQFCMFLVAENSNVFECFASGCPKEVLISLQAVSPEK